MRTGSEYPIYTYHIACILLSPDEGLASSGSGSSRSNSHRSRSSGRNSSVVVAVEVVVVVEVTATLRGPLGRGRGAASLLVYLLYPLHMLNSYGVSHIYTISRPDEHLAWPLG